MPGGFRNKISLISIHIYYHHDFVSQNWLHDLLLDKYRPGHYCWILFSFSFYWVICRLWFHSCGMPLCRASLPKGRAVSAQQYLSNLSAKIRKPHQEWTLFRCCRSHGIWCRSASLNPIRCDDNQPVSRNCIARTLKVDIIIYCGAPRGGYGYLKLDKEAYARLLNCWRIPVICSQ